MIKGLIASLRLIAMGTAIAPSALAQSDEAEATLRAYAAGYKAAFTCSGLFNAGKTLEQIKAHELTGIYPRIQPILGGLPDAVIDHEKKIVSVRYSDTMPPRISAVLEPYRGCTQLPAGFDLKGDPSRLFAYRIGRPTPWSAENPKESTYLWRNRLTVGYSTNASLNDLGKAAMSDPAYGKDALTTAILVATPQNLLLEKYIKGFTPQTSQRTWSVAKSIGATYVGMAIQDGAIKLKEPAPIKAWSKPTDPRNAITLENLLHMASGLDSNRRGNRTDRVYMGGGLVINTATQTALEAVPGTRWKYANNDTMLAARAATNGYQERLNTAPSVDQLFAKLGMHDTVAETDWNGDYILSSQVWTTARDLARLGVLYLQDGVWEGERLLPEGWVEYVSSPIGPQPPALRRNGEPNPGYGAQWWLYNERFREKYPGIPTDTFAARGNRGQFLVVIPSKNLVIVRRGYDPAGGEGFKIAKFIEDVVAALEEG